jgi:hypothetical protein
VVLGQAAGRADTICGGPIPKARWTVEALNGRPVDNMGIGMSFSMSS